ncbi:hypothetical protein [Plantactinospora mayteni]|uniref:hypothetical protein n=1 Tax=Plantactinospora mayteni TaxID=566021 RepID=UPI00194151FF|nr:hypothetical protein [Plantactinospora mayteni]
MRDVVGLSVVFGWLFLAHQPVVVRVSDGLDLVHDPLSDGWELSVVRPRVPAVVPVDGALDVGGEACERGTPAQDASNCLVGIFRDVLRQALPVADPRKDRGQDAVVDRFGVEVVGYCLVTPVG